MKSHNKYEDLLKHAKKGMENGLNKKAKEDLEWLSEIENSEIASEAKKYISRLLKNYPIVVFNLKNDSVDPVLDQLALGLTAMISSDLKTMGKLNVLERKGMRQLLKELNFAVSGYIDSDSIAKIRKNKRS